MTWPASSRGGAIALAVTVLAFLTAALDRPAPVNDAAITGEVYPAALSDYGFFTDLHAPTPATRVTAYTLNTPLFSDYAEKHRYLYLPAGAQARYQAEAVLDLPVGGALIKTFGYSTAGVLKPLETRVLLHRAGGWVALPYVWNADGSDAVLKRGHAAAGHLHRPRRRQPYDQLSGAQSEPVQGLP